MAVTVAVDADSCDEVQLHATVAQFNKRAVAQSTGEIREVEIAAADSTKRLQRFFIASGKFRIRSTNRRQFRLVFGNRFHDQLLGLLKTWIGFEFVRREHGKICDREEVDGLRNRRSNRTPCL